MRKLFDFVGALTSFLCIIHCVSLPLLIVFVPSMASYFSDEGVAHYMLYSVAIVAALLSIAPGYRMHLKKAPLIWLGAGLASLGLATFAHDYLGHDYEPFIAVFGSLLIIRAHYLNHKLCHHCHEHNHGDINNVAEVI